MTNILITGGTGQVGTYLRQFPWPAGIDLFAPTRAELNLSDVSSIEDMVDSRPWAAVINCGASTAVDLCENEIVAAWQTNALAPAALAQATARAKVPLIHVSTDYVFGGDKVGAYVETDAVAPLGVYGASKEGGEQAVRTANPRHVIVRTAWVVSPVGNNFIKTMLRVGAERPLLRVVNDQHGCPTHAGNLAAALAKITLQHLHDANAPTGTYHFTNAGQASWFGLAQEIFRITAALGHKVPQLEAITSDQYPLSAKRPANSLLSTDKITRDFGIMPRPWQDAVQEIVHILANKNSTTTGATR